MAYQTRSLRPRYRLSARREQMIQMGWSIDNDFGTIRTLLKSGDRLNQHSNVDARQLLARAMELAQQTLKNLDTVIAYEAKRDKANAARARTRKLKRC